MRPTGPVHVTVDGARSSLVEESAVVLGSAAARRPVGRHLRAVPERRPSHRDLHRGWPGAHTGAVCDRLDTLAGERRDASAAGTSRPARLERIRHRGPGRRRWCRRRCSGRHRRHPGRAWRCGRRRGIENESGNYVALALGARAIRLLRAPAAREHCGEGRRPRQTRASRSPGLATRAAARLDRTCISTSATRTRRWPRKGCPSSSTASSSSARSAQLTRSLPATVGCLTASERNLHVRERPGANSVIQFP